MRVKCIPILGEAPLRLGYLLVLSVQESVRKHLHGTVAEQLLVLELLAVEPVCFADTLACIADGLDLVVVAHQAEEESAFSVLQWPHHMQDHSLKPANSAQGANLFRFRTVSGTK